MPKSSLSTAARKKQAAKRDAKANAGNAEDSNAGPSKPKLSKKERKNAKNEPRKKEYKAPVKPQGAVDPVDVHGLGTTGSQSSFALDPRVIVALRRLHKKDEKTLVKALEDFDVWLKSSAGEFEPPISDEGAILTLPVWLDHFNKLARHPSRRIRSLLAAQSLFFAESLTIRASLISQIQYKTPILCDWLLLAHDIEKTVSTTAKTAWQKLYDDLQEKGTVIADLLDNFVAMREINNDNEIGDTTEGSEGEGEISKSSIKLSTLSRGGTPDSAPTGDEEDITARNTRFTVAILGSLSWLLEHSSNRETVFKAISETSAFDFLDRDHAGSQPPVRRAVWSLIATVQKLDLNLDVAASNLIYSALYEESPMVQSGMWQPFLQYLKNHPNAWTQADADDNSDSDEDQETLGNGDTTEVSDPGENTAVIRALYHFIHSACPANPTLNYPAVLVLLSVGSLGDIIAASLQRATYILSAFEDGVNSQPKLDCYCEVSLHLLRRVPNSDRKAFCAQFAQYLWAMMQSRMPLRLANVLSTSQGIERVQTDLSAVILEEWSKFITEAVEDVTGKEAEEVHKLISQLSYEDSKSSASTQEAQSLAQSVLTAFVDALTQRIASTGTGPSPLFGIMQNLWEASRSRLAPKALKHVDTFAVQQIPQMLVGEQNRAKPAIAFLVAYVQLREDTNSMAKVWTAVFDILPAADSTVMTEVVRQLGTLAHSAGLPTDLPSANLDHWLRSDINTFVMTDSAAPLTSDKADLYAQVMTRPDSFIQASLPHEIMQLVSHQLDAQIEASMRSDNAFKSTHNLLALSHAVISKSDDPQDHSSLSGPAFKALYLVPQLPQSIRDLASRIRSRSNDDRQTTSQLCETIRGLVSDNNAVSSPAELVLAWKALAVSNETPLVDSETLEQLRNAFLRDTSNQTSEAAYFRAVVTIMVQSFDSRPNVVQLETLLLDLLLVDVSGVKNDQEDIGAAANALQRFAFSSKRDDDIAFHQHFVEDLQLRRAMSTTSDFGSMFTQLFRQFEVSQPAHLLLAKCLSKYLRHSLQYASDPVEAARVWFRLAVQSSSKDVPLSLHLIDVASGYLAEDNDMQRFQNRMASDLSAVKATDINTKATPLLRLLNATAPSVTSSASFLPEQRIIFVLKSAQAWIAADNAPEPSDDLLYELATFFNHIAPAIQSLSGHHWDFMFDIVSSLLEDDNAAAHLAACNFLDTMHQLCSRNKELQEQCGQRLKSCDQAVLDLFCSNGTILEGISDYVADHCPRQTSEANLEKLLSLATSSSTTTQPVAVVISRQAIKTSVEALSVELEVAEEVSIEVKLPQVLLQQIAIRPKQDVDSQASFLLVWQMTCHFLEYSSPRLRSMYVDQLRKGDPLEKNLLPTLVSIFNIQDRVQWPCLDLWSYANIEGAISPDENASAVTLLAANVYLNCLKLMSAPIRAYWEGIRNRQLSEAFSTFTERYFSILLIEDELQPLRENSSSGDESLIDENMSVRVATNVNEIKVVYTVDEQPMELSIRLPSNYPLAMVDIRDTRKIGVSDATWRAWILAMQQAITSGRSRIIDALHLFKKNISLHFEGVEACAICYSVISLTDQSKPSKKCRTCKNIFHAGCLFKWFSTSHGSSCPLCRSLF